MFPAWLLLILSRAKGLCTCLSSQLSAAARPLGPIKCAYLRPHTDSNLATRLNHATNVIICGRGQLFLMQGKWFDLQKVQMGDICFLSEKSLCQKLLFSLYCRVLYK